MDLLNEVKDTECLILLRAALKVMFCSLWTFSVPINLPALCSVDLLCSLHFISKNVQVAEGRKYFPRGSHVGQPWSSLILGVQLAFILQIYPSKPCKHFSSTPTSATCPTHPSLRHFVTPVLHCEERKTWSSSLRCFSDLNFGWCQYWTCR